MSASLVGSEMCIRDRTRPRRHRVHRQAAQRCDRRRRAELPMGREAAPPVSYTHLTLPTICSV
eukprot:5384279-Alexandrium_andersonii.AAC.1